MNRFKAFFRNYRYEITALVVDALVVVVAYSIGAQFLVFFISLFIFVFSTFVVIYFRTKEKDFYYFQFNKPGQEQDWVGRGDLKFIRNEKCFEIKHSHVGYILPKTSNWDDYRYELDFKITNISFGFIVRAINLSNYVMFQIFNDYIKPHLRINGQWIILEKINITKKLDSSRWYKLIVICEKKNVRITIKEKTKILFDKYYPIHNQLIIEQKDIDTKGEETSRKLRFKQDIDFDFGSIGIRNHGEEHAFVRNVFVEKL